MEMFLLSPEAGSDMPTDEYVAFSAMLTARTVAAHTVCRVLGIPDDGYREELVDPDSA